MPPACRCGHAMMHNETSTTRAAPLVFLVSHSAPGGAQELWADLAEGFAHRGHAVQLAALYPAPGGALTSSELPWHYVVEERPRSVLGLARLVQRLAAFHRERQPRMVFTAMP